MNTVGWNRLRATAVVIALLTGACSASDTADVSTPTTTEINTDADDVAGEGGSAAPVPTDQVVSDPVCGGSVDGVETHQYRTIDGVDPDLLSLDVHRSEQADGCPVVVYVHGGSWQTGDKATRATAVKADHLVGAGFVFVSVNYRLVAEDNDVRWPDFSHDVAAAVDWVISNAVSIGGDPSRVSIIGHSAGAHLVSILGTNPALLGEFDRSLEDVSCVVSLDSVDQLLAQAPPYERDIVALAFGDDPAVLADGSPTAQAREHLADTPAPEFLIVTRGRDVRIESSERLRDAITEVGGTASVIDVSPYDHRDVNVRFGEPGESALTEPVTDFLADCASV